MKLTTVAVYNDPMQANMARNALDSAGIRAVIADAELVAMDLLLSSAVGGVKVQVREEDAERAAEVLTDVYGDAGSIISNEIDEAELERQALEATPHESEELPEVLTPQSVAIENVLQPAESERNHYARRSFYTTVFSFLVPLIIFYAIYLLLNAVFGTGSLSRRGLMQILFGSFLLVIMLYGMAWVLAYYGIDSYDWLP